LQYSDHLHSTDHEFNIYRTASTLKVDIRSSWKQIICTS